MAVPDLSVMGGKNSATARRVAVTFAPEAGVPGGFVLWPGDDLASAYTEAVAMVRAAQAQCDGIAIPQTDGDPLFIGAFAIERVAAVMVITIAADSGESAS